MNSELDLTQMFDKDTPADLQSAWHDAAFHIYKTNDIQSIIDIGAGRGFSKERLSKICPNVTTQDINRALMLVVDIISGIDKIFRKYDLVTAFDVFEHVPENGLTEFLTGLELISNGHILITTPNGEMHKTPWHYTPKEFDEIIRMAYPFANFRHYLRFKTTDRDYVESVSHNDFRNVKSYALGIAVKLW